MVIERLGLLFTSEEHKRLDSYRNEIYHGLDIDGVSFLKLPKDIERGLVNDVAKILIATSANLKKPIPEVGLIHGWSERLEGYSQNHEIREVLANTSLDKDYPRGIIRISPFYLKPEFTKRVNFEVREDSEDFMYPLEYLLAHEDFHVWQFLNQYEKVMEDCKAFKVGGLAVWDQTQTEIDANQAARNWIEKHRF